MTNEPICIEGLTRRFGQYTAVDGLDLEIKKNSFTGLLGPNGAGKSTTLKILTNLIRKTSGSVCLNGVDVTRDPEHALIGVGTVVETPEFYSYLTPRESLRYIGKVIGMSSESISAETDEILKKMKMSEWSDKKIGTFSKGMRQRIAIGQALMDHPSIIILDEPTSGLDPRGMAEVRDILSSLKERDMTVLMSSHLLNEVRDLCDRVAMIDRGKLLVHDDIDVITSKGGTRNLRVRIDQPISDVVIRDIGELPNVISAANIGSEIGITISGGNREQAILMDSIRDLNVGLYSISESGNSLETKYLEMIKEAA